MGSVSNDVLPVLISLLVIVGAVIMFFSKKDPQKEAAKKLAEAARQSAETERKQEVRAKVMEMRAAPGGFEGQMRLKMQYGEVNPALFCSHCQTKGQVRSQKGKSVSKTSSGVINDVLVGGQKTTTRDVTKFHCDNCSTDWEVA